MTGFRYLRLVSVTRANRVFKSLDARAKEHGCLKIRYKK